MEYNKQEASFRKHSSDFRFEKVCSEIALELEEIPNPKPKDFLALTKQICSKYKLPSIPGNEDILKHAGQNK
ncbi:MAG TPA: hypothetical protein VFY68_08395, partial [Nitrososphaeraceae archaeon]|nr:hypothetical protein [Nitrososphaeraceae archaeon]